MFALFTHLRCRFLLCLALGLSFSPSSHGEESWGLCHAWPAPQLQTTSLNADRQNPPLVLHADSSELQNQSLFKLQGDVLIQRPGEQLRADRATYNSQTGQLDVEGGIRFDTKNFSALSSSAHFNLEANSGELNSNEYFIYSRHMRGGSERIQLQGESLTVLKKAQLTSCDPGNEAWALNSTTIKLNHANGMGSAFNTYVTFQGVPFFYLPYLTFPITGERTSGLLVPTWGSSDKGGNELALPFYWNIHPQVDATITPRNYTDRGLQWNGELRYLSRFGEGEIGAAYLDDDVYGDKREQYRWIHKSRIRSGWSTDIAYRQVSDAQYFSDFGRSLSTTSTSYLERHAKINYRFDKGQAYIQAQDYQILDETTPAEQHPYRRLPQLVFEYLQPAEDAPLSYGLSSEWVRYQRQGRINGTRSHVAPFISVPYQRTAGYIKPKISLHYRRYELDDAPETSLSVPIYSIDSGLYFERNGQIGNQRWLQTIEPRLFYLQVPYYDQANLPLFDTGIRGLNMSYLFAENRFTGPDRIGDTQQLSWGLTHRWLEADSGKERFSATAGQIVYFENRRVGLDGNRLDEQTKSATVIETQLKLNKYLRLKSDVIWDTDSDLISRRNIKLQYQKDNRHIINLGYRYQHSNISNTAETKKEIDISLLWPINHSWSIIARRYHSLPDNRTLEQLFGVEYDSCCWAFRLVRRAVYAQNDASNPEQNSLQYSLIAQLELKGLTSLGTRIEELMEKSIVGYSSTR